MPNDDWQDVWQNQPVENMAVQLEEIRRNAEQFTRRIRNRNRREYIAGAFVVAAFTYYLFLFRDPVVRAGSALTIAGALYVLYQLHRRSSPASLPRDMGITSSLSFHRRELVRQRDALESVWSWYLAPFAPGLIVFGAGSASKRWIGAAYFVLFAATFGWIWWLNRRAAQRISKQIEELDKLGGR